MEISPSAIKELRERTGAGVMDCKKALAETSGNVEKAVTYLREKGLVKAAKRAGRVAAEGIVEAYIHLGGRIGVLVEVNCETDFVARTEDFRNLAREVALQVAASRPLFVDRSQVPPEMLEEEKKVYRAQALAEGKPERVVDKIVEGRLEKFFQEVCLLDQPYIREQGKTVKDVIAEVIARVGENITIRRFARFEVGEGVARPSCGDEGETQS